MCLYYRLAAPLRKSDSAVVSACTWSSPRPRRRWRAQHASGTERAPCKLVVAHEPVEPGEVFVEAEHVRDRVGELRGEAAYDGLDPQLLAACGDAHDARVARDGECRLERARRKVDTVRRQLGDAVRAKSTGSPPAPRSDSSAMRVTAFYE